MMRFIQRKKNLIQLLAGLAVLLSPALFSSSNLSAIGLKIAPLKYEEMLELGTEKTGHVDVANPNDFTITIRTGVEGFRQINSQGDLEFFQDDRLSEGIVVDVDEFELGPREAARIIFTINTNLLPEGGVYAALFFETDAQAATARISSIGTTARAGTLLILQNGDGERIGDIDSFKLPFWQFGGDLTGSVIYSNPETGLSVGYAPELTVKVSPWGGENEQDSGLVLPGVEREFMIKQSGNYFGLLPIILTDYTTGSHETAWVFAVTGVWRVVTPFFLLAIAASLLLQYYFKRSNRKDIRRS